MRSLRIYALAGLRVEALKVLLALRMVGEMPRGKRVNYII